LETQGADLALHGGDVVGDFLELAIDRAIHGLEKRLQRLRGDLGKPDHVGERDVLAALLPQIGCDPIEMLGCRGRCHGRLLPASARADRAGYSANTASILVLSVWALNGLTM